VNNFQNPYEPKALKLPPGKARVFQKDLKNLVEQAKRAVPAALQNDEFVSRGNGHYEEGRRRTEQDSQ